MIRFLPPPRRHRAFTLIELLVVIAIAGLLAALVLPALARSHVKSRSSACASNMRQIGLAMQQYTDDHEGAFPRTTHGAAHSNSWIFTLSPYLADVDRVRISPGDPRGRERLAAGASSYVMNEYIAVRIESFGGVVEDFTNLRLIANPSGTFTAFIGADRLPAHVTSDHTHSRAWPGGWDALLADIQPDRHRSGGTAADHTRGSANYLYADTHVATIDAADLAAMYHAKPDLARPPE